MTDYKDFLESHNNKLVELMDKQFEQLLKAAAKNLRGHDDFKSYKMNELVDMMKGGDGPPPKKAKAGKKGAAKKASAKDDDSSEDSKPDFPKGMTEARWAKCCELLPEREDDQFVNVKTGKLVKKNARNKDAYYWRKHFCAPMVDKQVVLWACRNEPAVEKAAEDDEEFEALDDEETPARGSKGPIDSSDEEDEDEDEPPRRRGKGKKAPVDDDSDDEDDEDEPPRRRRGAKNLPVDDDTEDDEDEDEPPRRRGAKKAPVDDDSSEEDQPPRRRDKKAPVDDDDEEEDDEEEPPRRRGKKGNGKAKASASDDDVLAQTSKGEDFTMKDLKALKKAAEKQKANGSYANAETRRSCAKSDRNKKNFNFFKAGYAVPKDNEELADAIKENW